MGLAEVDRTILICVDRKTAKCATAKEMEQSWKYLKTRLKALGLTKNGSVLRLKMGCCGVCKGGPIAAVLPDGIWYGRCTPEVLETIIQQHLIEGVPVDQYIIARPNTPG